MTTLTDPAKECGAEVRVYADDVGANIRASNIPPTEGPSK